MFPFKEELSLREDFRVHHKVVVDRIGPLLTPERRQRVDAVVKERCFDVTLILEGIYDRGNISAVMRTAEGLGFADFHVVENQPRFKEANRVTKGADKWVEVRRHRETREVLPIIRAQGKRLVVTALTDKAKSIEEVDFSVPTAIVLGNEKEGVSEEMIAAADEVVVVPMVGFVQSFNISVAGALVLAQIRADRIRRRGHNGDLTPEQMEILRAEYYLRTLDSAEDILRQTLRTTQA